MKQRTRPNISVKRLLARLFFLIYWLMVKLMNGVMQRMMIPLLLILNNSILAGDMDLVSRVVFGYTYDGQVTC